MTKSQNGSQLSRRLKLALATLAVAFSGTCAADTVLITGANSGIGLELSKQYAEKGWDVIATHRRDQTPDTLAALAKKHPKVRVEKMDVSSHEQVFGLAKKMRGQPIDVLINNAGIFRIGDWEDDKDTSQTFGSLNYEHFDPIMRSNIMGVIMVSEAFVENVKAGKQKKMITMSSSVGTLSRPGRGAFWYASSKAAVNKINVNLAEALKSSNVIVVPMHPGAVRVEKQANDPGTHLIDTDFSVRNIISTIDKLTMSNSGKFTNYDGKELPW